MKVTEKAAGNDAGGDAERPALRTTIGAPPSSLVPPSSSRASPVLTHAARPATFDVTAVDEHGAVRDVPIAGEHPLTLYVDKQEILTLMTLGAAPEALAFGYLRNQRLVQSLDDIAAVQVDWETNSVAV
jgi:FdhD protein